MEITHRAGFLISEYDFTSRRSRISFTPSLGDALVAWRSSTRISPLFGTSSSKGALPDSGFSGWLFLCGPVDPLALPEPAGELRIWLSLGLYNVVGLTQVSEVATEFRAQLSAARIAHELWEVQAGEVVQVQPHLEGAQDALVIDALLELSHLGARAPEELQSSVSEYCALMASSLRRTQQSLPEMIPDLLIVHQFVSQALADADLSSTTDTYRVLGILAHLNGGLSRFAAQTLSGTSPVDRTECHFWVHSLLGAGIANLVLQKFAAFVMGKMDSKQIPARLRQLGNQTDALPTLANAPGDFWHGNHLEAVEVPTGEQGQPLVPLLTYFSGRDGFRSGLNTVSAPLTSISACNTRQWSLMTMTHEISHVLVRSALTVMFPDPTRPGGREALLVYLEERENTWLRRLQSFLLEAIIAMQQTSERTAGGTVTREWNEGKLTVVLDRWHHEVEEIMVHVFDFLYFYGQDTERYVRSVWLTWGVIPNIANRVNEYVVRTLCAALVKHLRRDGAEEIARSEVLAILAELRAHGGGPYVEMAHVLLSDDTQWPVLRSTLVARKGLVKIVRGFLYWDKAAQDLRGDSTVASDASDRGGYRFKVKHLSRDYAENPLRVVQEYTDATTPSDVTSAWLLYLLAFNIRKTS